MNALLILANISFVSFFLMRYICGKKWGKSTPPKTLEEFLKKEFLVIVFTLLVVCQNFGMGFYFQVPNFLADCLLIVSLSGIVVCYETRKVRFDNWGRFATAPKKNTLITTGPYLFSRHPYYLGVLCWGWATSFLYGNLSLICLSAIWTIGAIFAALKEERFLEREFAQEWSRYKKRTPFLIGISRR